MLTNADCSRAAQSTGYANYMPTAHYAQVPMSNLYQSSYSQPAATHPNQALTGGTMLFGQSTGYGGSFGQPLQAQATGSLFGSPPPSFGASASAFGAQPSAFGAQPSAPAPAFGGFGMASASFASGSSQFGGAAVGGASAPAGSAFSFGRPSSYSPPQQLQQQQQQQQQQIAGARASTTSSPTAFSFGFGAQAAPPSPAAAPAFGYAQSQMAAPARPQMSPGLFGQSVAPAPVPLSISIETIARAQEFNGAFKATIFSTLQVSHLTRSFPSSLIGLTGLSDEAKEIVWATAVALAFLEKRFGGDQDSWTLLADKAREFAIGGIASGQGLNRNNVETLFKEWVVEAKKGLPP